MTKSPLQDKKDELRYSYTALFILCFAYIMIFGAASFFSSPFVTIPVKILSIVVPLLLARFMPLVRSVVVDTDIGFSPRPCLTTLWLLPLFVGTVYGLSLLSGKLATIAGVDTSYNYGTNIWLTIFSSALIPAVTEELFCRYIFLPRLSPYSESGAVFASALFFSFMHGNFFQIPYALAAGILLGALAVGCGSILPCILFHFVNNLTSILLYFYQDTVLPRVLLYVLLAGLIICALCAVLLRRRLWERLRAVFACDRMTGLAVAGIFTTPVVIYLIVFVGMALAERFM